MPVWSKYAGKPIYQLTSIISIAPKAVKKAVEGLSQKGINVWLTEPEKPSAYERWDFNDALLNQGKQQVKHDLDCAIEYSKSSRIDEKQRVLNKEVEVKIFEKTKFPNSKTLMYPDALQKEKQRPEKEVEYEK